MDHHRNLPARPVPCVLRGWGALVQALGGEKPLARAKGDRALLVQAMGGWAPLVWAKGSRGLSAHGATCVIYRCSGTDQISHLRNQREAWPATTRAL